MSDKEPFWATVVLFVLRVVASGLIVGILCEFLLNSIDNLERQQHHVSTEQSPAVQAPCPAADAVVLPLRVDDVHAVDGQPGLLRGVPGSPPSDIVHR